MCSTGVFYQTDRYTDRLLTGIEDTDKVIIPTKKLIDDIFICR